MNGLQPAGLHRSNEIPPGQVCSHFNFSLGSHKGQRRQILTKTPFNTWRKARDHSWYLWSLSSDWIKEVGRRSWEHKAKDGYAKLQFCWFVSPVLSTVKRDLSMFFLSPYPKPRTDSSMLHCKNSVLIHALVYQTAVREENINKILPLPNEPLHFPLSIYCFHNIHLIPQKWFSCMTFNIAEIKVFRIKGLCVLLSHIASSLLIFTGP